jgi:hypothetical protein
MAIIAVFGLVAAYLPGLETAGILENGQGERLAAERGNPNARNDRVGLGRL